MTNPITHATLIADLEQLIAHVERANRGCEDNLMNGEPRRVVLAEMSSAFRVTGRQLVELRERVEASAPPEPASRPLKAIFADIRAEGHENIHLRRHSGTWWLSTAIETERRPNESNQDYLDRNEDRLTWTDTDDPGPLAEARLVQIREMHAAAAPAAGPELAELLKADIAISEAERVIGPEEVDTEYEASPPPPEAHAAYPDLDALLSAEEARRATAASEHIENITDAEDGVVDGEEG